MNPKRKHRHKTAELYFLYVSAKPKGSISDQCS